ncbi:MAG: type 1 glutamine amidotransferase [Planctomycetota bacterium]|nr:type 1 glutamine amidotransferase [Planctomycetota bacterium]
MIARRPCIGITPDLEKDAYRVSRPYADLVARAGGTPLILPCRPESIDAYLETCAGFLFSGGDDPDMRRWNLPLHPQARPIDPRRQAFELDLLAALDAEPERPVLGVCLGMQLMALHAGGALEQYLPDALPTAGDHWGRKMHAVNGELGDGIVHSHHRQAIIDPGRLRIVARAPDGVIEAVAAPDRACYLGVQWHPERTEDAALGYELIRRLVAAAGDRSPR